MHEIGTLVCNLPDLNKKLFELSQYSNSCLGLGNLGIPHLSSEQDLCSIHYGLLRLALSPGRNIYKTTFFFTSTIKVEVIALNRISGQANSSVLKTRWW